MSSAPRQVIVTHLSIDGLVQERRNSTANALELRLSCTNPSIWGIPNVQMVGSHLTRMKGYLFISYSDDH